MQGKRDCILWERYRGGSVRQIARHAVSNAKEVSSEKSPIIVSSFELDHVYGC